MNTTLSKLGKFKSTYQKFRGANKLITKSNVSMKELLLSNDKRYIWNKYHVCYVKEMSSTQRKCLPSDKNVWYATEMSARHSSETRQVAAPPGDRMPPLQACPPNSRSLPANLFGLPYISCLPFRTFCVYYNFIVDRPSLNRTFEVIFAQALLKKPPREAEIAGAHEKNFCYATKM